ncbi:MAG: FkbM family methyltransferase [Rickettsiales bacterium]|jgi:FkbM family methyltransferase|nr:FkbM family methyltransferase [Rickettsiales bacterium]
MLPHGDIAAYLFFFPRFESTELELVDRLILPGMQIIDVGANVGLYSIICSKRAGDTGVVYAFEPAADILPILQENLKLNGCSSVRVYPVALGSRTQTGFITCEEGYGDAYRYVVSGDSHPHHTNDRAVDIRTLDEYFFNHTIQKVDFLKIDIEGGEYQFFLGARETLKAQDKAIILFENDPHWARRAGQKHEDCFILLESIGYTSFSWDAESNGWIHAKDKTSNNHMYWACRNRDHLPVIRS